VERANEEDLLSGEGSRLWGQRWNPPGLFRTVYLSLDRQTAEEEALAQNRRQGLPDIEALPLVLTGARVSVSRLLDLSLGKVRTILRVSAARMRTEPHDPGPESVTQAIGRLAYSEGYQGLLVPSAAVPGRRNLVIFPEKLSPRQLVPVNPEKLPPRF
jgi:RES domain-containing protein